VVCPSFGTTKTRATAVQKPAYRETAIGRVAMMSN
jgi:hypothetical protein